VPINGTWEYFLFQFPRLVLVVWYENKKAGKRQVPISLNNNEVGGNWQASIYLIPMSLGK
jgi:hypothetical protein